MDSIEFVPHSSVCTRWCSLEPDVALAALGVLPARGLNPKPRHPAKPLEPWAPSVVSRPHRRLARRASSNYRSEASSDDRRKSDPIPNEPPFLERPLDDCGTRVVSPPRATAHAGVLRLAATTYFHCFPFMPTAVLVCMEGHKVSQLYRFPLCAGARVHGLQ